MQATRSCSLDQADATARPLTANELPPSPVELATELIARSGVWRSKEQYLATLFILRPLQVLWEQAKQQGGAARLLTPGVAAQYAKAQSVRSTFLHGPGGSGKTHCMTEVVMMVFRHFLGGMGVKAIAAHNSSARLLLGKTIHTAGRMRGGRSLNEKHLKPAARTQLALAKKWCDTFFLLGEN